MKALGFEFKSSNLHYVLLESDGDSFKVLDSNRLVLADTRSREALIAFQNALNTLYNSAAPDRIAIKSKPEKGNMKAGAASLKIEGIALANAPCAVCFISSFQIKQCEATQENLSKYLEPALKAAVVALGYKSHEN